MCLKTQRGLVSEIWLLSISLTNFLTLFYVVALKLRSPDTPSNIPAKFYIHTMQVLPSKYCKEMETQKLLNVSSDSFAVHTFKCEV